MAWVEADRRPINLARVWRETRSAHWAFRNSRLILVIVPNEERFQEIEYKPEGLKPRDDPQDLGRQSVWVRMEKEDIFQIDDGPATLGPEEAFTGFMSLEKHHGTEIRQNRRQVNYRTWACHMRRREGLLRRWTGTVRYVFFRSKQVNQSPS